MRVKVGDKYAMLTVLEIDKSDRRKFCKCLCECGNITTTRASYLTCGHTKSCGCLKRKKTHGLSRTRLQTIYYKMLGRCYDSKNKAYANYGGRGISVCAEWRNDKTKFFDWALANGYTDELTIDRVDTNGNYEPSNCRWATRKEQSNNLRNNVLITYNNETHTRSEWSDKTGISYETLRARLNHGWAIERALTEEVHKNAKRA